MTNPGVAPFDPGAEQFVIAHVLDIRIAITPTLGLVADSFVQLIETGVSGGLAGPVFAGLDPGTEKLIVAIVVVLTTAGIRGLGTDQPLGGARVAT